MLQGREAQQFLSPGRMDEPVRGLGITHSRIPAQGNINEGNGCYGGQDGQK